MGKFMKRWRETGRPFSGARLDAKLRKQGVPAAEREARVAKRVDKLNKVRDFGTGMLSATVSGVPGLGSVGRLIDKVPGLNKVPVLKGVAREGVALAAGGSRGGSILADLVPAWHDFKRGDYKGAALSLAAFAIVSGGLAWLAAKLGVTLPAWVAPTLLDLLNSAGSGAAS